MTARSRILYRLLAIGIAAAALAGAWVSHSTEAEGSHTFLRFPFQYGHEAEITNGYNSPPTHVNGGKWAIDFEINGGSTSAYVVAAANGTVVDRVNGVQGCGQPLGNGNYVDVQTADPASQAIRYARYGHLTYQSVVVSVGQAVYQGTILGRQGGTGWLIPCGIVLLHFRWASTQDCNASSQDGCEKLPEPMSGETDFAIDDTYVSDNLDRPPVIEGTLFKSNAPGSTAVYVAENGKKRYVNSLTNCGYQASDIVGVMPSVLSLMPNGAAVSAAPCPGTLFKKTGDVTVWVVESGFRRKVTSSNVFNACGYSWSEIVTVSSWGSMLQGGDLIRPPCPYVRHPWVSDALIHGSLPMIGAAIYVTDLLQIRHILSSGLFEDCGYRWNDPIQHPGASSMSIGSPVSAVPCPYTLVQGTCCNVYLMQSGQKRLITSSTAFEACGFAWEEIVPVSQMVLDNINTGLPIYTPPCPYTRS